MKVSPKVSVHTCTAEQYEVALRQLSDPAAHPLPLLQAPFYGAGHEKDGKTVVYFAGESGGKTALAGLAVKYDAPGGISFLYCPYGPAADTWSAELLLAVRQFFAPIAKQHGVTFVRLDSMGLGSISGVHRVSNALAATASLQPRAEWLLDISGDQEAIWMGMHKHARYNVRLAERANAQIDFYEPADAPIETFMSLMQITAGRDSFGLQRRKYYEAVLGTLPAEHGFMSIVTIDNKPATAAIFAEYDGTVHYVFSGSSDDFRKIAPPYFMIWQTILEAKRRGWRTLDFGGISDTVKSTHLAGVTGFKKRFGGYEANHENPVDLVYNPFKYGLFAVYKTLRS